MRNQVPVRFGVVVALALGVGGITGHRGSALTSAATTSTSTVPATAASTSTSVADPAAAAVAEAAQQAWAARAKVLVDLDDPVALAAVDQLVVTGSPARFEIDGWLNALRDTGQRVRENASVPPSVTVEDVVLGAAPLTNRAALVVCVVDSAVVYAPGAGADGSDQIVDDTVDAYRAVWEMTNVDGQWKFFGASTVDPFPGATECPPADAVAMERAAVVVQIYEIQAALDQVTVNLDAPGNDLLLAATHTQDGPVLAGVQAYLQELRDTGDRMRVDLELQPSLTVEKVTLLDGPPSTSADAVVCEIDSSIRYEPAGAPDGQDAIVNDQVFAYRALFHLVVEDGSWQLDSTELIDLWEGLAQCPAA